MTDVRCAADIPTLTTLMGTGPYRFTDVQYDLFGILTNKVPTDAYRGAGRPEATYFQERMMDAIADLLPPESREVHVPTDDELARIRPTS